MAYRDPEVARAKRGERYLADREALIAYQRAHYKANREAILAQKRLKYAANAVIAREKQRAYAAANREAEKKRAKEWRLAHPEANRERYAVEGPKLLERGALRRQAIRRRVPWFDTALVKAFYTLAKIYREAGIDCHVDHIAPLRNKLVCGLHVQTNLTILLTQDNLSKGNRHWPDMPDAVSGGEKGKP